MNNLTNNDDYDSSINLANSDLICECPLNGDLMDISGNNNHFSGKSPDFESDPENPSRRVLNILPSEDGGIIRVSPAINPFRAYKAGFDFYSMREKDENIDLHLEISGVIHLTVPGKFIPANTWINLTLEISDTGHYVKVNHSGIRECIMEERINGISTTVGAPTLGIGYSAWRGKALKGYLKNFRISRADFSEYTIYDCSDLVEIQTRMYYKSESGSTRFPGAANGSGFEGKNFRMMNDIDFSNRRWNGIGIYNSTSASLCRPFKGTFDGGDHAMLNLNFSDNNLTGLFNCLENATIKNLTFEANDVTVTGANGYRNSNLFVHWKYEVFPDH